MSLSEQTRAGLREMPSNAAWLLSRVLKPVDTIGTAAESATASARDRGRKVRAAVVDTAPVGGNSVEIRLKRAQDAGEQAREAEDRAVQAAQESRDRADHASQVSEHGRTRVKEIERETSRRVKQRIAEAQKSADEWVKHELQAAESDAAERQQEVRAEVDQEVEEAQREAETCQQRAEELVETRRRSWLRPGRSPTRPLRPHTLPPRRPTVRRSSSLTKPRSKPATPKPGCKRPSRFANSHG